MKNCRVKITNKDVTNAHRDVLNYAIYSFLIFDYISKPL